MPQARPETDTTDSPNRPETPPSPDLQCKPYPHTYDSGALLDYWADTTTQQRDSWTSCHYQPCPHRYLYPSTDSEDLETRLPTLEDEHQEKEVEITLRLRQEQKEERRTQVIAQYIAKKLELEAAKAEADELKEKYEEELRKTREEEIAYQQRREQDRLNKETEAE